MSRTRVAILGSTGSVGTQALAILRDRRDRFDVVALTARRGEQIAAQAAEFSPTAVCMTDADPPKGLPPGTTFHRGADGVLAALDQTRPDIVLNAITGAAGLPASEWTLRAGRRLALANKESLVMAGEHLMQLAENSGAIVLPVDSEHCAIHQCLRGEDPSTIRRIWLTGSGGPFLHRPLATFPSITRDEALRHPTWTMGPRITIGSATMMNKAFEVLEAHWLFGLPPDKIQVVLHPQSIVHSMVEFVDGSIVAQCGVPDMRVPILYCLSWPERTPFDFQPFDPSRWRNLEFLPIDAERYPAVPLAYETLRLGGDSGAVLNAADEELTRLFLAGAVPFPAIVETTARILRQRQVRPATTLANVLAADRDGRTLANQLVATTP
ncbi:MAG: 1-deoxy-D-xylulose-5-phosphate reductoisomerase [Planctomycetes bacterium]|nr:1-deoxy-D-xylulose-5-phosphate reductoisomerase [Planctomycetota bacterium]